MHAAELSGTGSAARDSSGDKRRCGQAHLSERGAVHVTGELEHKELGARRIEDGIRKLLSAAALEEAAAAADAKLLRRLLALDVRCYGIHLQPPNDEHTCVTDAVPLRRVHR